MGRVWERMQQRDDEGRHQKQLQTTSYGTPIQGSKGGKGKTMPKARDGENSHLSSSQSTFQWMSIPFYIPLSHQPWKAQLLPLHIPKALILLPALRFLGISISFNRLFCLCGTLLPPNELLHEFRIHQRYFHCLYLACCKNPNI